RRRHTRFDCDWSSDVCSSDLGAFTGAVAAKPGLLEMAHRGTLFPDLVEEERAAVRHFQQTGLGGDRAREGALLIAEELALQQLRPEELRVGKGCVVRLARTQA